MMLDDPKDPIAEELEDEIQDDEIQDDADSEGLDDGDAEDGGEEDAAGEDEGQEGRPDKVTGRQPSRAERRIEALAREAREAKEAAAEARRDAAEARAASNDRRQQQDREAEELRLAAMTPEERFDYRIRQNEDRTAQALRRMELRQFESSDKISFAAECRDFPAYASIKDEVERRIAINRNAGGDIPRAVVANLVLGERMRERASRAIPKQKRQAAADRARQTARPSGGRSDTTADRRGKADGAEARRKRLDGLVF